MYDVTPGLPDGAVVDEAAVAFAVRDSTVVGVLSRPVAPATIGVIIVVGGPQYRVGSHRQFVALAWALAAAGVAVLRFDYRGMGDSGDRLRSFEQVDDDLRAAVDTLLREQPQLEQLALWGLCDGASAALMYAPQDDRVTALALANPWARGDDTQARTQLMHYYARRLFSRDLWRRALGGRLRLRQTVGDLSGNLRRAVAPPDAQRGDFRDRMTAALATFDGPVLWLMSGDDLTAREFETYMAASAQRRRMLTAARCERVDFATADHTFSRPGDEAAVAAATVSWLARQGRARASTLRG